MKIYIFDIDGTLTNTDPTLISAAGYSTHAYWDLLTFHFVKNKEALQQDIDAWRPQVKLLSEKELKDDFIASSADMMQRALHQMTDNLTEQDIVNYANKITHDFIDADIVVRKAIDFLNEKATTGNVCILSTGSYQSGAIGFLNALSEKNMISYEALDHIMISGAIVDWLQKKLTHANIHNNKIKGLNDLLQARYGFALDSTSRHTEHEVYVYADDPEGNDFGILSLAIPENRIVIAHAKNKDSTEYARTTWDEMVGTQCYL